MLSAMDLRDPDSPFDEMALEVEHRGAALFETGLSIADRYGYSVMPILFERYHDFGGPLHGIYIEHFMPEVASSTKLLFNRCLSTIVGHYKDNRRILAWDICNEHYVYNQAISSAR